MPGAPRRRAGGRFSARARARGSRPGRGAAARAGTVGRVGGRAHLRAACIGPRSRDTEAASKGCSCNPRSAPLRLPGRRRWGRSRRSSAARRRPPAVPPPGPAPARPPHPALRRRRVGPGRRLRGEPAGGLAAVSPPSSRLPGHSPPPTVTTVTRVSPGSSRAGAGARKRPRGPRFSPVRLEVREPSRAKEGRERRGRRPEEQNLHPLCF